jgi:hypothetical protein
MEKIYRIYEIVDIETGEILKANYETKTNYKTIKIEKNVENKGKYKIEYTKRIVRHNGQQQLF